MNPALTRQTNCSALVDPAELATARRLFLKGVLPGHKPTITITLQTASPVRVSASRTQRIVV